MYSVTSGYLSKVKENVRNWDLYIDLVLSNNTRLRLQKKDIDLGTFTLKEGATCSDTIQMGSTYSNSVEFRIVNDEGQYTSYDFYRAKVYPYVGLDTTGSGSFEYVPIGEFNILDNVKKFSTISVTCFDNMSLLNKVFDFSQLVFPTTPVLIFDEVVEQCGIEYNAALRTDIQALTYEISSLLTNDPTCRDILAGFGVMLLRNLRFDRTGKLESFWYQTCSVETNKNTRVGNSKYGDNQIVTTGVYIEDAYGNTFSVGTEEYAVELPTSPILQGSDMCNPLLESALTQLQQIPYRVSTITWIGDPAIQVGDMLTHEDTAVGSLTLPVMRLIYKFAGTSTLESLGIDRDTLSQETTADRKLKKAFSKAEKDRYELESKIDQRADEVLIQVSETYTDKTAFSQLKADVTGISSSVIQQTSDLKDVKRELSTVQQSATALDVSIKQVLANGTDKVTTETGFTFNKDGLKVSKSTSPISTQITEDGMTINLNGETLLTANHEGVEAKDLHAKTYLIIGGRSRFENYGSDRTGCFWIGEN